MATPNPWDEYRRRRNLAWFAFLGYVPVCFTVGMLSMRVVYIHSGFRSRDCVDGFLCHRREPSPTVPLSKMRQMVLCEMVVSQQLRTPMCPLRLAQIRRPKDRFESVSVKAWLQQSSQDFDN